MGVFTSGAFLQQCFSVHPLTLNLKLVTPPSLVGIFCANCRMKHRLTVRKVVLHDVDKEETQDVGLVSFHQCSETHPEDVRISSVDVVRDAVEFRCRPCRRTYLLEIGMIESHQS
jgi:hypothetical protein